jgi:hypothetical protein
VEKHAVRNIIFSTELTRAAKAGQKSTVYRHDEPNKSTMEGPLSNVLQGSPFAFASVSTVSRGHLSLVSLDPTLFRDLVVAIRKSPMTLQDCCVSCYEISKKF